MKSGSKLWKLFAGCLLLVLLLAACQTRQGEDANPSADTQQSKDAGQTDQSNAGSSSLFTEPGNLPIVTKPVTLSIMGAQDSVMSDYAKNPFTKWVEDQTGLKIEWQTASSTDINDKKNLALASGDYPTVFMTGFSKAEEQNYGQQGVFLPLNDLIDKYAPNIKEWMNKIPYMKGQMTALDGNIYGLPNINECYHCTYSQKLWINRKWLDQLGLQMPTTTDEFEQVLKAFAEKDPNGNGKKDEIPLSGFQNSWHGNVEGFLMNAFIPYNDGNFIIVRDGKVMLSASQPEWKEGLAYIHKLYSEGLIDRGSFTQNNDTFTTLANHPGDNLIGAYTAGHLGMGPTVSADQDRWKDYAAVPPLKGPNGAQYASISEGLNDAGMVITNKADKDQQIAAIRLADFMSTEDFVTKEYYGLTGTLVREAKPDEKDTLGRQAKYTETMQNHKEGELRDGWGQIGPIIRTKDYRFSFSVPEDPYTVEGYEYLLTLETRKYEGHEPKERYPGSIFYTPEDAEKVQHFQTDINKYINENVAKFIVGDKDLNKDWDAYVTGFDKMNVNEYLGILQKSYEVYKKNSGQ